MLAESDGNLSIATGMPNTLQALIAARIDRLPALEKRLDPARRADRAHLLGGRARRTSRRSWTSSSPQLESLVLRELVLPEARSTISGERAFKFKHVLIREVAYGGLSKSARAAQHARFAGWLKERAGDELLEIRAFHLDQRSVPARRARRCDAARPRGRGGRGARGRGPPRDGAGSVQDRAQAAASRARARADARAPLARRARGAAARRHAAVSVEMEKVRKLAAEQGRQEARGVRAGRARGGRALHAGRPRPRAKELSTQALELLSDDGPVAAKIEALQRPRPDRVLGRRPRDGGGVPPPCPRRRARSRAQGPRGERDPGTRVDVHHEARPSPRRACCSSAG